MADVDRLAAFLEMGEKCGSGYGKAPVGGIDAKAAGQDQESLKAD
jgi:hypothetical protein